METTTSSKALIFTAWKVSVFGDFLVRIFLHSDWIRNRKTPNTDTFYAVVFIHIYLYILILCKFWLQLLNINYKRMYFGSIFQNLIRIKFWNIVSSVLIFSFLCWNLETCLVSPKLIVVAPFQILRLNQFNNLNGQETKMIWKETKT